MEKEELKSVKVAVKLELMKCSTCSQRDTRELFKYGTMESKSRQQHGSYSKVSTFN